MRLQSITVRHRGSTITLFFQSERPIPPTSDLHLGHRGTSSLLAEIGRRYEPRIRCQRGHTCRRSELSPDGLCPRCLSALGLS